MRLKWASTQAQQVLPGQERVGLVCRGRAVLRTYVSKLVYYPRLTSLRFVLLCANTETQAPELSVFRWSQIEFSTRKQLTSDR